MTPPRRLPHQHYRQLRQQPTNPPKYYIIYHPPPSPGLSSTYQINIDPCIVPFSPLLLLFTFLPYIADLCDPRVVKLASSAFQQYNKPETSGRRQSSRLQRKPEEFRAGKQVWLSYTHFRSSCLPSCGLHPSPRSKVRTRAYVLFPYAIPLPPHLPPPFSPCTTHALPVV